MSLQSTAIFDRRVYAADTAPDDERDGVLWVDTSQDSRPLYVYSSGTAAWELASPEGIAIQDTAPDAPNLGDGWIDTSGEPRLKLWDGVAWLSNATHGDVASYYIDHYEDGYPEGGAVLTENGTYTLPQPTVPTNMYMWHEYHNDCSVTTEITLNFTDGTAYTERFGKHTASSGRGHTTSNEWLRDELRANVPAGEKVETVDWWHEWDGSDRTDYTARGRSEVQIEWSNDYPEVIP